MRIYDSGVYRDATAEEIAEMESVSLAAETVEELTMDDVIEILAEQEYRLCLVELGVAEDDL